MSNFWDSVTKGFSEVSKKAGELWDGVAGSDPDEDSKRQLAQSAARDAWGGRQPTPAMGGYSTASHYGSGAPASMPPTTAPAMSYGTPGYGQPPYTTPPMTHEYAPASATPQEGSYGAPPGHHVYPPLQTTMPPAAMPGPLGTPGAPPVAYGGYPASIPAPIAPSAPHTPVAAPPTAPMPGSVSASATPVPLHLQRSISGKTISGTPKYRPKEDGFVTTAGNRERGAKYGNATFSNQITVSAVTENISRATGATGSHASPYASSGAPTFASSVTYAGTPTYATSGTTSTFPAPAPMTSHGSGFHPSTYPAAPAAVYQAGAYPAAVPGAYPAAVPTGAYPAAVPTGAYPSPITQQSTY